MFFEKNEKTKVKKTDKTLMDTIAEYELPYEIWEQWVDRGKKNPRYNRTFEKTNWKKGKYIIWDQYEEYGVDTQYGYVWHFDPEFDEPYAIIVE